MSTGKGVANYIEMGKDGSNIMAVCVSENLILYKIDPKTGKLEQRLGYQADFKEKEPGLNCCALSNGNQLLATGGEDCNIRVVKLNKKDFKSYEPFASISGHMHPITGIDFSHDLL